MNQVPEQASYSITAFAYNEEKNIEATLKSILVAVDPNLDQLTILANGCSDNTAKIAENFLSKQSLPYKVISLELGDKCNAWNTYVYEHLTESAVQFFIDCDVQFSEQAFPRLANKLNSSSDKNAVTGLPLSGRNRAEYSELVTRYSCLFGNLYGLKQSFLTRLKSQNIRLPVGLCWIDAQLTKLVNEDLRAERDDYQPRVTFIEGTGYLFESLKPWRKSDRKLYLNRIARYKAGQLQEPFLDELEFSHWPETMEAINQKILDANPLGYKQLGWKRIFKNNIQRRLSRRYTQHD
jgi:glycosyltransferase involved in cell wall biosynthesis